MAKSWVLRTLTVATFPISFTEMETDNSAIGPLQVYCFTPVSRCDIEKFG